MFNKVIILIALTFAGSLAASTIASESFATPEGYEHGLPFGLPEQNRNNLIGTTGFSQWDDWHRATANVTPRDTDSLTHDLLVGTAFDGAARLRTSATVNRIARRYLKSEPTGSTFFMSGLVSMRGDPENMHLGTHARMGLSSHEGLDESSNFSRGFFLGLHRNANGSVYLAAYADGNTYTLGNELTGPALSGAHIIVLRAELGQRPGANDTLTAWYVLAGTSEWVEGGSWSGINIADSSSDLRAFGLGVTTDDVDTFTGTPDGVTFDEFRFGTEPEAVVRIQ